MLLRNFQRCHDDQRQDGERMPGSHAGEEGSAGRKAPLLQEDVPLGPMTTLGIGGPCRALVRVSDVDDLKAALSAAQEHHLPVLFLGAGSNVLFDDRGYEGLVVRNEMRGVDIEDGEVEVAGGHDLGQLIRLLNRRGLGGLERMYGIPGSVAGAVVGNAGAYGQEIGERIVEVEIFSQGRRRRVEARELNLSYRHSRFKERPQWFLLSCRLRLDKGRQGLQGVSDEILAKRLEKYPPELRCPGSFFKNLPVENLPRQVAAGLPEHYIHYGKVPAGILLEAVGAKGTRRGDAQVASYHGNLFLNAGRAASADMLGLAGHWASKVKERFDIELEAEIRIVGPQGPDNISAPASGL
ncbi:MAG TPA: UDP-N-acetylmuramate dehydrogenase [Acidobacteriota bacterium]|nr:UDP-N-acetylmuramate dehydrogenase [Acidobacteriota bacterium]